jgi:hypothetical protein
VAALSPVSGEPGVAVDIEQIALLAGVLFILIAVVGGGFTVREIKIPKVPGWARLVSLVVGLAFIGPFLYAGVVRGPAPPERAADADGASVIYADNEPDRSRHGLMLTQLVVRAPNAPPRVGDAITVEFALKNVGAQPITFSESFVAARSPADENRDFGYGHQGLALALNETVKVKANLIVDAAGAWSFWPCYILADGSDDEDAYCPDRWRAFSVTVVE